MNEAESQKNNVPHHQQLNVGHNERMNATQSVAMNVPRRQSSNVSPDVATDLSSRLVAHGIEPVCLHFLKNKSPGVKCCKQCENQGRMNFAFWNNKRQEWQNLRQRRELRTEYQVCWHYLGGRQCTGAECGFAHGEKELYFWNELKRIGLFANRKLDYMNLI